MSNGRQMKVERDDDLDALFRLPLAEFTNARNALAAQLKKSGQVDKAARVKALVKPPISAWAVNQLYWNHREAFDRLITSGERFHRAQTSGKIADMRVALDARREVLSQLTDIAASLLRDASHNPSLDTIQRISTTLEGMSVYALRSDGPRPGRLTHDVDPPGFESLASFGASEFRSMRLVPPAVSKESKSVRRKQSSPQASAGGTDLDTTSTRRKTASDDEVRKLEEKRKTKIAEAKVSLQDAKRSLTEARASAQSFYVAQKRANAEAEKAEKHKRDAEEELKKAKAASEDAARRARSAAVEVEEALKAVSDAERDAARASKELEAVFRESGS
jgi:hypothetical protein